METNLLIFFITFFSSIFHLSTPADFECDYRFANFWVVGQKYSCEVNNNPQISTQESALMTNISGIHQNDKSIDDVTFFRADKKGIEYFPQGLEKFFTSLKGIVIGVNKLKEIRSTDLKAFPNLTYLNLGENLIQVLEDGLFDNNPELEILAFWGNKIIHIGMNVFSSLTKLTSLSLGNNVCIELIAEDNTTAVQNVINKARIQCKNYAFLMYDGNIKGIESDSKNLNTKFFQIFEQNLYNLECEIKNSKFFYLSSFKKRIQKLKDLKLELKVSSHGNDQNEGNATNLKSLINQVQMFNVKFEKIEKDVEATRIDILKSVDKKIAALEKRLMDKIDAVVVENVKKILKAVKEGN